MVVTLPAASDVPTEPDGAVRAGGPPAALDALLSSRTDIRRGTSGPLVAPAHATGFAALDAALPARGWPVGGIAELLVGACGIGETSLLLPALAALTSAGGWVAFVAPPHEPCAPALVNAGGAHGPAADRRRPRCRRGRVGRRAIAALGRAGRRDRLVVAHHARAPAAPAAGRRDGRHLGHGLPSGGDRGRTVPGGAAPDARDSPRTARRRG